MALDQAWIIAKTLNVALNQWFSLPFLDIQLNHVKKRFYEANAAHNLKRSLFVSIF